jgi:hypothetical protein
MAKPVLGIDFGTTNQRRVHRRRGRGPSDRVARRRRHVHADGGLVRRQGERARGRQKDRFPFKIVAGPDGDVAFECHGRVRPIVETTFHILARVLELANAVTGIGFEEVVLTASAVGPAGHRVLRGGHVHVDGARGHRQRARG